MADKKISALTAATTPLAGTEVLPIVQSGATVKVSVTDLTAGRGISATSVTNGLGAVATPSYTFTGDTNTGMWSPAADTIAFSEGGNERVRIINGGNVGIGTSAPSERLSVAGSIQTTNAGYGFVGVTSGAVLAQVACNEGGGTVDIRAVSNHQMIFYTNNVSRMRITTAGAVGIGAAPNAAARLDVSSTTSGFLPPRMTEAERDLIATPPDGLMLYNSTTNKLQVRAAGSWVDLH
jgi:hypothetical protein